MRRFVLGDVHGAYRALIQCLERSNFDYSSDQLIFLGDVCDGWPEVPECIEEFIKIRNLVYLKGNHDLWLARYLEEGEDSWEWQIQGGFVTKEAYLIHPELKTRHLELLQSGISYYLDEDKRLFVHAGFNPQKRVDETDNPERDYYWSRDVYHASFVGPICEIDYREIYIGHTPIHRLSDVPMNKHNVWLMDTGAGWNGLLSIMNVDSKEVFQSDPVTRLYPNDPGRMGLTIG